MANHRVLIDWLHKTKRQFLRIVGLIVVFIPLLSVELGVSEGLYQFLKINRLAGFLHKGVF